MGTVTSRAHLSGVNAQRGSVKVGKRISNCLASWGTDTNLPHHPGPGCRGPAALFKFSSALSLLSSKGRSRQNASRTQNPSQMHVFCSPGPL